VEKATSRRLLACLGIANTRSKTLPLLSLMLLRALSSPFTNFGQIDGRCLTLFPRGQGVSCVGRPRKCVQSPTHFSCSSRTLGPGNIRELRNVIERWVMVCETEIFTVDESWLCQRLLDTRSGSNLLLSEKVAAAERGRRLSICTRGYLLSAGLRRAGSSRMSRRAVAQ
jgi:hypothetical protein